MSVHIFALIGAIVTEVIGTSALQASQQFTRAIPTAISLSAYGVSIYLLGVAMSVIPMGVAYAVWSGLGIFLITLVGRVIYGQILDTPALIGLGLIICGVMIIQLFSSSSHG